MRTVKLALTLAPRSWSAVRTAVYNGEGLAAVLDFRDGQDGGGFQIGPRGKLPIGLKRRLLEPGWCPFGRSDQIEIVGAGEVRRHTMRKIVRAGLTARVLWSRFGLLHVNLRAAKRVAVYPSLGLAYNRIKKNANTTVVMLLREMETGAIEGRKAAKSNSKNFLELSKVEIAELREACFFIVIRNPYSRVLSAFLDKFRNTDYQVRHGPFDLSPEGFDAFVEWLSDGGLDKDAHWDLQTKLMFLPLAKYDAVVRFENFEEDMGHLLKTRELSPPPDRLGSLNPGDTSKRTSSDSRLQDFYNQQVAAIVADLFAIDFHELGYSRDFPSRDAH